MRHCANFGLLEEAANLRVSRSCHTNAYIYIYTVYTHGFKPGIPFRPHIYIYAHMYVERNRGQGWNSSEAVLPWISKITWKGKCTTAAISCLRVFANARQERGLGSSVKSCPYSHASKLLVPEHWRFKRKNRIILRLHERKHVRIARLTRQSFGTLSFHLPHWMGTV